jgi:hypothetical protein
VNVGVKMETHGDRPPDGLRRLHGDFLSLLFTLRKNIRLQNEVPSLRVGQLRKEYFVTERQNKGTEPVIITVCE